MGVVVGGNESKEKTGFKGILLCTGKPQTERPTLLTAVLYTLALSEGHGGRHLVWPQE